MTAIERVLHLVTPGAPGAGAAMLRLIGASRRLLPDRRHEALVIGSAAWSRTAALVGLGPHRRIPPLLGSPALSARSIRAAIDSIGADLVHAWDSTSIGIVVGRRDPGPAVATLGAVPPPRGPTPLALDRVEAIALGERARRDAVAAGWLHARVRSVSPPALSAPPSQPPGERESPTGVVATTADGITRRRTLRAEWEVDEESVLIAVIADPPEAADAWLAYEMAARAVIAGHRVRLLCPARLVPVEDAARWSAMPLLERMLIADDRAARPWEVAEALDAAILAERSSRPHERSGAWGPSDAAPSGPLSLAWLHAAGVPILCTPDGPHAGVVDATDLRIIEGRPNPGAIAIGALSPRRVLSERCDADLGAWALSLRELYGRAAAVAGGVAARPMIARADSK